MTTRMLVTYASRSGSTAEIAEAIGRILTTPSLPLQNSANFGDMLVDVLPMPDVRDVSSYQAVIAGSAIRGAQWLPEAMQFIRLHQSTLRQKPFAMFTVCITLAMRNGEQYRTAVKDWTAPVRNLVRPLSEAFFAGMLDFDKLPTNWETMKLRATVAMGLFPRGDHRDWNAVRDWAESLKPMLTIPV